MSSPNSPPNANAQPTQPKPGHLQTAGVDLGKIEGPKPGSGKRWSLQQLRAGEATIPIQSGTNKFSSQKGSTGFGTPRDVKGKHLKRIWELEYPEACEPNN